MRRNISRIKVLCRLYEFDLMKNEEYKDISSFDEFDILLKEMEEDIEYDEKFALELYNCIINNLTKIDRTIAISLTNYPLDRLSYVDRNLLRIGTCELLFMKTPKEVVINEIVEMSKDYSQTEKFLSSKFNNSVLDNICKRLNL